MEIHWNTDGTVTAKRGVDIWPEKGEREFEMPKDMTKEQVDAWVNGNTLLNRAIPQLNTDQAEFLLSGFLPGEYDRLFAEKPERLTISLGEVLQRPVHQGSCNEIIALIAEKLRIAIDKNEIGAMPDKINCSIHNKEYVISFEPKEYENLVNITI